MRNKKGQALLIAVLLMTVILLVGGIFVAIVIYTQGQTARHGDLRQAEAMCDAGMQFVDRMLRTRTADYRPPEPPAWCSGADGTFDSPADIADISYSGDDEFDPGFWGADGAVDTEDDYYTYEELVRGWCPKRLGGALPPDPNRPEYADPAARATAGELVVRGFTRIPDPRRGAPPGQDFPATVGNGHALVRVTYDPDPPFEGTPDEDRNGDGTTDWQDADPNSNMIRIESIGAVVDVDYTFRRKMAYKPILGDYVRHVTDKANTGKPIYLGIPPAIDFNADGVDDGMPERYITQFVGSVRVDGKLVLVGDPLPGNAGASTKFQLYTDCGPGSASGIPYLERNVLEATAGISFRDRANATQAEVTITGPAGTNTAPIEPSQQQIPTDAPFDTLGALTGDDAPAVTDGRPGLDAGGYPRFPQPRSAPKLFDPDPVTGRTAYEELTRYSGGPATHPDGYAINSGETGYGDGIYVNNATDRQFLNAEGRCDYDVLMDDWLRNISPTDARAEDSGWNAVHTTYTPVGVEIYIVGQELPASVYQVAADPRTVPRSLYWSPAHIAGEPQVLLIRHDRSWLVEDPANAGQCIDSGRYAMLVDHPCELRRYPTDPRAPLPSADARWGWPWTQVIMTAGNARVTGILPPRPAAPAPGSPGAPYLDYGLTIVSGGTIYIDGSILSPRDVASDGGDEERNTYLALLARDCVCLNATRIVPQEASALVSAVPDDTDDPRPEASHWEVTPEAGARLTTTFRFGAAPPGGNQVYLAAVASGDDPGPAALALGFQQAWVPGWVPFDFDPGMGGANPFLFVPPGYAAGVNISDAISPNYQPVPDPALTPAVPWNITPYISTVPGQQNNLAMYWANPAFTAGATNPWVKGWKIVESTSSDPADLSAVTAAVHCRVNAVIYAENGCWFVIPGHYFKTAAQIDAEVGPADLPGENVDGVIDTDDERARARAYLRYNYDIVVNGSITEGFTAPAEAVYEWTDKWACPGAGPSGGLLSISYLYDPSIRVERDRGGAGVGIPPALRSTASADLPRVPHLPVSPDLLYYGEPM